MNLTKNKLTLIRLVSIMSLAISFLSLSACKEEAKEPPKPLVEAPKEKVNCIYSVEAAKVNWKAYKFTEKAGVGGSFDSTLLVAPSQSVDPLMAISNASLVIDAQSVNSTVEIRDEKLRRVFFGPMAEAGSIKTMVKSVDSTGAGTLVIVLNGIEKEIPFNASFNETVSLKATIDLNDFNAQEQVKALNEECKDLHQGKDGKSVLWPDVDIEAVLTMSEKCG